MASSRLCVSCSSSTLADWQRDYDRARAAGADVVELRLDLLIPAERDRLDTLTAWLAERADTVLMTCRATDQGGQFEGDTRARFATLARATVCGAGLVDIEFVDYTRSADLRGLGLNAIEPLGAPAERLVLSDHNTTCAPSDPIERLNAMTDEPCAIAKLVWRAETALDGLQALDLQRSAGARATVFCMGPAALPTRVLGRKFGAPLAYVGLSANEATAPGQPSADDLLETCRWRDIDADTHVYGLIGDPVTHSLSPTVHNAAFAAEDLNAVYVPWRVPPGKRAFVAFMQGLAERPWLDLGGLSVTAPHKEHAFELIAPNAAADIRALGAVNTLKLDGTALRGDNTDQPAALAWIVDGLGGSTDALAECRIALLGAGGLARTLAVALHRAGAHVTVHNRTPERARRLAEEVGCAAAGLDAGQPLAADAIVNCTPLGTWPDIYRSPLDATALPEGVAVFDAVYCPQRTRLLELAAGRGCSTHDGLTFFLKQAARQFTIWTGRLAPTRVMRAAAERTLQRRTASTPHGVS